MSQNDEINGIIRAPKPAKKYIGTIVSPKKHFYEPRQMLIASFIPDSAEVSAVLISIQVVEIIRRMPLMIPAPVSYGIPACAGLRRIPFIVPNAWQQSLPPGESFAQHTLNSPQLLPVFFISALFYNLQQSYSDEPPPQLNLIKKETVLKRFVSYI